MVEKVEIMYQDRTVDEVELEPDEAENYHKGLKAKVGDIIDVNDYGECEVVITSDVIAHLVLEEDGSIRWYVNPEIRSDVLIRAVYVKFLNER